LPEPQDPRLLIQQALAGDPVSVRSLVDRLSPVVSKRVAATLWQRSARRNVAQDAVDMTQDVFLSLFQANGKALRAWDPTRGMSFESFVGLLAQHQVISILRNGRTAPWRDDSPEMDGQLEALGAPEPSPEAVVSSRECLRSLLDRLKESLSPRGLELFQRIIIDEEPIDALSADTGLSKDAIYQWKSRLHRTIRALADEGGVSNVSGKTASLRMVKRTSAT
jgi:DNA-directed RNA polymerase specialized sigma24 family protein